MSTSAVKIENSIVSFTPKELRITQLVTEGWKNRDIARAVGTTHGVVRNYIHRILDKTGMSSRLELALWYLAHGD